MGEFTTYATKRNGVELLITPVTEDMHQKSLEHKKIITDELENRAHMAGLRGRLVTVWRNPAGTMTFFAPPPLHSFFENITLDWVLKRINKKVEWQD